MITLDNVLFNYPNMPMHFDFKIKANEKVALIGESGAGKSTILNLIAGFEFCHQGKIILNGIDHTYSSPAQRPVSMLFQENNLFTHLNVAQNISLGIKPKLNLSQDEKQQVASIAQKVGLTEHLASMPNNLSGGQKQRVALARCMLRNQPILLLDEPFSALDLALREEIFDLILQLCKDKSITLVMVTHQLIEVEANIDRVIEVHKGRIINS